MAQNSNRRRGRGWREQLIKATALFGVVSGGDAAAARSMEDACGAVNFTLNQAKHYGKSEFIKHAAVAEIVGELVSVFYDPETNSWSISPQDLKEIVLKNINRVEGTKIYGSAIAFEPDVWNETEGLEEGVPYPAVSDACLDISSAYCEHPSENSTMARIDSLARNAQNETIYSPYAYQGSPFDMTFINCSAATPHFCPTMDLSRAYDYSDANNPDVEWYTAPRCLFYKDGTLDGYWTSPYFDAGAGNINMVTYAQPIVRGDKFLGVATIDIEVEALCYGNQCVNACPAEEYNYTVSECQSNGDRTITYTTSDPSCSIDSNAVDTLSCSYVPASSAIGISLLVFGAFGAITCLLVLIVLVVKRNSAIIRASQINISIGFVVSGVLANVSTFSYVGDRTSHCAVAFWAAILPITIQLAFLFGKVYRTYKLFLWSQQFKRKTLSDAELLSKIAAVILTQVGLLIMWTLVEDPTAQSVQMEESVDKRYCVGEDCHPTEVVCQKRYNVFGYFPVILLAILVIAGCVLTYQSRTLPNCFCEAKHVMFAMYTVALVYAITIMVVFVGGEELPVSVYTLLLTVATCTTATWSVLVIFLPKFLKLWTLREDDMQRELRSKVHKTNSKGDLESTRHVARPGVVERKNSYEYDWKSVSSGKESNNSSHHAGLAAGKNPYDRKSEPNVLGNYGSDPYGFMNGSHDWKSVPNGLLGSNCTKFGNRDTERITSTDWRVKDSSRLCEYAGLAKDSVDRKNEPKLVGTSCDTVDESADLDRRISIDWKKEVESEDSLCTVRMTMESDQEKSGQLGSLPVEEASNQETPELRRRSV